jgi:hypothetical protein
MSQPEARSLMIHHIRTSCRRSAGHTDGGHPMLFAATVLGAPAVQQEVRSSGDKKVEDIQVMDLLRSCEFHARESSEETSCLLIF